MDTDPFDLEDLCPDSASIFSSGVRGATKVCGGAATVARPSFAAKPTRCTLPVGPFGSSSTMSTWRGTLKSATRPMANWRMSFGVAAACGPQYDGRRDVLAQRGVGDGKGYGLCHRRMFQEHFVDFPWREFLSTAIDDLLRMRPARNRYPSSSKKPRSPVLNQSPANAASVAIGSPS